jgi:hypothetical protein
MAATTASVLSARLHDHRSHAGRNVSQGIVTPSIVGKIDERGKCIRPGAHITVGTITLTKVRTRMPASSAVLRPEHVAELRAGVSSSAWHARAIRY